MIRIICGTRPEAVKLVPLIRVLKARKVAFEVIHTGQHVELMAGTGLKPDVCLGIPSNNDPQAYVEPVLGALEHRSVARGTSWVVVQGDTASALAGARWARWHCLPLCHVEAGLRSHDRSDPWPEEDFRVEIDLIATLCCCPTMGNYDNLMFEGEPDTISRVRRSEVTGNTIVDALRHTGIQRTQGNHVLITLHRREAFGEPLLAILKGLSRVAREHPDTPFLWPVHPNPEVRKAIDQSSLPVNVMRRDPLPYLDFLSLLASAKAVLTDSGGVVEEACTLGVPTVIARDKTERPEAIESGWACMAGKTTEGIAHHLHGTLGRHFASLAAQEPQNVFGDAHAAERISDLLTA